MKNTLSWSDIERESEVLARRILSSGYQVDLIGAVPRGGWTVAALIAQHLNVVETIAIDIDRSFRPKAVRIGNPDRLSGKNVLLVEDSVESGSTLHQAMLAVLCNDCREVRTTAIFVQSECSLIPDYFTEKVQVVPDFPWDFHS